MFELFVLGEKVLTKKDEYEYMFSKMARVCRIKAATSSISPKAASRTGTLSQTRHACSNGASFQLTHKEITPPPEALLHTETNTGR
jgi:hypothetical protein